MSPVYHEQINETVKQFTRSGNVTEEELVKLTDHVMDFMLSTGNSYINTANLNVDIDFLEATIRSFYLLDEKGSKIDMLKYTQKFTQQLAINKKEGIKRLSKDIFYDAIGIQRRKYLIFGKN